MKKWWLVCTMLVALPALANSKEWDFRVTLDHHDIGDHRFTLQTDGPYLKLDSEASFDYRVLFFSVFKYVHHDVEYWKDDCLNRLDATTRINGKTEQVQAQHVDDQLRVEHAGGWDEYSGCVKSFAYWNPNILTATQLLNSQTGEYTRVSIKKVAEESIEVKGVPELANRYHIQGPKLSIDIWYVGEEWVALQADTEGGRKLKYQLR